MSDNAIIWRKLKNIFEVGIDGYEVGDNNGTTSVSLNVTYLSFIRKIANYTEMGAIQEDNL